MENIQICVAVVLFAFGDIALSNNASDTVTDNPRLSVMLEEDQSDRVSWKQKKMDSATIMARDESRRSEVRRMLASAQVRTAHDCGHFSPWPDHRRLSIGDLPGLGQHDH
jgi:hypothetical protein